MVCQAPIFSELWWQIFLALAESDRRVQELVDLVARPMNAVPYHMRLLRNARMVEEHRSAADGRDLYYVGPARGRRKLSPRGASVAPGVRLSCHHTATPNTRERALSLHPQQRPQSHGQSPITLCALYMMTKLNR